MSVSAASSVLNEPFNGPSACFGFRFGHPASSKVQENTNLSDAPESKEIDNLLASAMNGLTFEERQRHLEIVHGVSTGIEGIEENDETTSGATLELLRHLEKLKAGTAYETAERLESSFVNDRKFQLMFLRGNEYNTKAAADQVIRFLEMKQRLFGKEKLTKQITLKDLDEDDRDFLKTGTIQLIGKDRMGRVIWFQLPSLRKFKSIENELRARFYMATILLKSEEVQKKGIVTVTYAIGEFRDSVQGEGYVDVVKLMMAIPFYHASFHNCVGTHLEKILGKAALAVIPASLRSRVRIQFGSHLETQYTLSTYGISPTLFPITPLSNKVRLDHHLQWYEAALVRETDDVMDTSSMDASTISTTAITNDPGSNALVIMASDVKPYDVLYDYGRTVKHEGNELVRALIREQSVAYDAGSNMGKREVIEDVIRNVEDKGGRFLKMDEASGGYIELTKNRIRSKVSQMFRNYRRPRGNTGLRIAENHHETSRGGGQQIGGELSILPLIDSPGPDDVVLGRIGKGKGNDTMLLLVKKYGDQYDGATRGEKSRIAGSIVQQIKSEGGRFVQPLEEGGWEEIPNEVARSKVAKCFRNSRRTKNKSTLP
ncbi:unnamed protein product [Cylindrotheca closterium]|uniref:DUF6824 domain-containing protein n=1 Tax=Cylindrotheca closterium TaxID=2856 RepID=A0AAD2CH16_9STRA|nr:unnamed protein product [Cylindrotheca closterium]